MDERLNSTTERFARTSRDRRAIDDLDEEARHRYDRTVARACLLAVTLLALVVLLVGAHQ